MIRKPFMWLTKIVQNNSIRLSSTVSGKPSYYHRLEDEPFQYYTVGQLLKNAAEKYGDRLALISCSEQSQITFNETLDKVMKISIILNFYDSYLILI